MPAHEHYEVVAQISRILSLPADGIYEQLAMGDLKDDRLLPRMPRTKRSPVHLRQGLLVGEEVNLVAGIGGISAERRQGSGAVRSAAAGQAEAVVGVKR
ncbi:MAG: hypothetical protein C5B60_08275 [Chloroflexi bacterium]|nr:MAG: hypothetical protein C5B60_08275 [Chloroflexota bacterium]